MAHLLWPEAFQGVEGIDAVVKAFNEPTSRSRLLDFFQEEKSPENAWFPLAVAQYRASPTWPEAAAIHDLFIPQRAPFPVNIPSSVRQDTERDFATKKKQNGMPVQRLFDEALRVVVTLIKDSYTRFKQHGLAGSEPGKVRPFHTHLASSAGSRYTAQLARKAQLSPSFQAYEVRRDVTKREDLKKMLLAASFDLAVMGLA